MNSNFNFIPSEWKEIAETAKEAEKHVYSAPAYTAVLCRKSLEEFVRWMYEHDHELELPYDSSLSNLLYGEDFKELLAPMRMQQLNLIRKLGNNAVHSNVKVRTEDALHVVKLLHGFISWVVKVYAEFTYTIPPFDENLVPKEPPHEKTKAELRSMEEAYLQQQEKLKKMQEELDRISAIKEQNIVKAPAPFDPNEAQTRSMYIDILLREAGWDLSPSNVKEYALKNCMPQANGYNGDGFADYVLWGDDGKALAVVEAKKTGRDPRVGQHQAKCYADCLEKKFGQRPLIFFSNGFSTWLWDDMEYPPREVYGFYTKDELQTIVLRRTMKKKLNAVTINDNITDRYYQHEAIRKVAETLERKKRDALLVMATGTGKTRVAASIIDLLSKAGWVKRVLFLADRNALIYQAQNNLNTYLPNLPSVDLTREKEDESSRIVFSTYQTMIGQIDSAKSEDGRHYGVGHFDLIIFDEIHRSVYKKYKAILKYFDGIRIGLTATPKAETHHDTYALFDLQQGDPTFAYELAQAVADGFLVPPKAISVHTKFHREGIKYADLSEEDKQKYEEDFMDPLTGEFPEEIDSGALNQWLFNKDTVDKVLGQLMEKGLKIEGGDKIGKTIIFARSSKHAHFIEERFYKQYPELGGDYLKVIDYKTDYKYDILNRFKDANRLPLIAVSVDMLDTGIDVPEVLNLVFFKPIRSSAKYWQMIGRGTRLCPNLLGQGAHKSCFLIFDLCENFEFFNDKPKGFEGNLTKSLSQRLFELRLKIAMLFANQEDELLKNQSSALYEKLIAQTQALKEDNFIVRQHWSLVLKYKDPAAWKSLSDLDVKELFDHIAPLVNEVNEHESAKRFDALMYDLQLSLVNSDRKQVKLIPKVAKTAMKLSKKTSIPAVQEKTAYIVQAQSPEFWQDVYLPDVEKLRVELRDLIKFLDTEDRVIYETEYEDVIFGFGDPEIIYNINNLETYKSKLESYLRENKNHLTIHKLRNNIPITEKELSELQTMLFEQGSIGTKEDFIKAYGEQPLGRFIRSILGMEANAAKQAFGEVLNNQTLNSQQIRFIDLIINYFTQKGIVEPDMLFEAPFTEINSGDIMEIFDYGTSERIISLIEELNRNVG
jgi:type I restriction enzyme R subunit